MPGGGECWSWTCSKSRPSVLSEVFCVLNLISFKCRGRKVPTAVLRRVCEGWQLRARRFSLSSGICYFPCGDTTLGTCILFSLFKEVAIHRWDESSVQDEAFSPVTLPVVQMYWKIRSSQLPAFLETRCRIVLDYFRPSTELMLCSLGCINFYFSPSSVGLTLVVHKLTWTPEGFFWGPWTRVAFDPHPKYHT